MNTDKIIEDYSNIEEPEEKGLLSDGGVILGSIPDEENRLNYIVKRDNIITIEPAYNASISQMNLITTSDIEISE